MLRRRILAIIQASPQGIDVRELIARVPDLKASQVHNAIHDLKWVGAIELAGYARYRVPERRPSSAGRGQVAPLSKLMAGR